MAYCRKKMESHVHLGDLVTQTGDWEIQSVSSLITLVWKLVQRFIHVVFILMNLLPSLFETFTEIKGGIWKYVFVLMAMEATVWLDKIMFNQLKYSFWGGGSQFFLEGRRRGYWLNMGGWHKGKISRCQVFRGWHLYVCSIAFVPAQSQQRGLYSCIKSLQ